MKNVSIIIAVHNNVDLTLKCLESLSKFTAYPKWELVIIDNASTDDTPNVLSALEGDVKVIHSDLNSGFAKANNWGVKESSGELLCFLNNDTVVTEGWLTALVNCLDAHPEAVACGGKLLFPDGTIQHAGLAFDKADHIGYHIFRGFHPDSREVNKIRKLQAITGACMLMHRWAFEAAGGFDEEYINGFEDVDICLTLGKMGGAIYYTPDCKVIHHTSATPGRRDFDSRNAERFQKKWFDYVKPDEDIIFAENGYSVKWEGTNCILKKIYCDIIIPVYDNLEFTKKCLKSIEEQTNFPNYRIIVVDNGSTDGTEDYLRSLENKIVYIRNRENLGYASACNLGASNSSADYLIFLNNDTEVRENWLTELVKSASDPQVCAVGSKLLYPEGTVQHAGVVFDKIDKVAYHIYAGQSGEANYVNRFRFFKAVTGACMLVKREDFITAGMFDTGYINGREDIDLCLKLGDVGKKIVYNPKSVVIHHESKTAGRKDKDSANIQRLLQKWGEKIESDEDIYYNEDGFKIDWVSRTEYNLAYIGQRAAIIIDNPIKENFLSLLSSIISKTVFPDYTIYIRTDEQFAIPAEFIDLIKIIYSDDFQSLGKLLTEQIICVISNDFSPEKGWLSRLVLWSEDAGIGELIKDGRLERFKGFPDLEKRCVENIKYLQVKTKN